MVVHHCPKNCGHKFDRKDSLESHLGQKISCDDERRKFPCKNEGCVNKSTSRQARSIHMKTCEGPKQNKEEIKQANLNMKLLITDLQTEVATLKIPEKFVAPEQQAREKEMQSIFSNLLSEISDLSVDLSRKVEASPTIRLQPLELKPQSSSIVSATDIIDRRSNQFYLCDPPGEFSDLKKIGDKNNEIISIEQPFWVIKIGWNGENTGRQQGHDREYGGISRVIDSLVTAVAAAAELKIKDRLINEGKLYSGLHSNKKSRDNELIVIKSQQEYTEYVELARKIIAEVEDSVRCDVGGLRILKSNMGIMKNMCRQMEAMVSNAQAQAKSIEDKIKH